MPISAALGSSALLPAGLGFRNKIMNGNMVVAQRGTAAITGSASKQFVVDRWLAYNGTGTVTFQQSSVAPPGFSNSLLATVTATGSYSTNGYTEFGQFIEGYNIADLSWGTSSAKPITISFWVRSSVVGSYDIALQNNAQNRSYITSFSVISQNTWEYKTIYVNGDTTGTWLTDNNVGLRVWFNLGMGTSYDATPNVWSAGNLGSTSSSVDFAANSGATFYITGVQLEQNTQPTPFEQRPYSIELSLCQRYFVRFNNDSLQAITPLCNGIVFGVGTGNAGGAVMHPVPMRRPIATSDITFSNLSIDNQATAGHQVNTVVVSNGPRTTNMMTGIYCGVVNNTTANIGFYICSNTVGAAHLSFNAEL